MNFKFFLSEHKKVIVKLFCLCVIGILGIILIKPVKSFINNKNAITSEKYTVISRGKSIDSIQAKGKIESLDDNCVIYASTNTQGFKVSKVNYEVGDSVNEGDILAVLDTSDLEKDIKESREKLKTSKAATSAQLKIKEDAYKNLQYKYDNNLNSIVNECEKNVQAAEINLKEKNRLYEQNKTLALNNVVPDEQLTQSKTALDNAQNTYDKAVSALESSKNDIEIALKTAEDEYEAAKSADEDKSGDIAIEIKEKQLEDCKIRAVKSGTIVKVAAKEGTPCGTTELFEIQNLENLIVKCDVKEKDISSISINQKAEITTDSLGNENITGTVLSIEPVAKEEDDNPLSLKDDSEDEESEFVVKVKLDEFDERIKSGMNADTDIILEENDDAYKVPLSSIVKDGDDNYIYVAQKNDEQYIVKNIKVTKGIENDTEVQIYGEDIKDGMVVLNSPTDYYVGKIINIKNET